MRSSSVIIQSKSLIWLDPLENHLGTKKSACVWVFSSFLRNLNSSMSMTKWWAWECLGWTVRQGSHTLLIVHDPCQPSDCQNWLSASWKPLLLLSQVFKHLDNRQAVQHHFTSWGTWRCQAFLSSSTMSSCSWTLMAAPPGLSEHEKSFSFLTWCPVGCLCPHESCVFDRLYSCAHWQSYGNSFLFHSVPVILKSTCRIDVRWFPFDVQKCDLKFGSWTYGRWTLDLQMMEADISSYTPSGEWDLIGKKDRISGSVALKGSYLPKWTVFLPAVKGKVNQKQYKCCEETYPDVTFTVVMQRRTLYYRINLLLPCVLISTLALLVFVLPADSGEKISLG